MAEAALDLAAVKAFLRIDGEEEDYLLADLLAAARQHAEDYLNAELPQPLPLPIRQSLLLLTAHFYEQRSGEPVPQVVYCLLAPYRNLHW